MSSLPGIGDICTPLQAQQLAVREALRGAGFVSPNPLVGCTIVSNAGRLLSTGYHVECGQAHAEVDALNKIEKQAAVGATLYVTLEPCAHFGRTPPCANRIVESGISRVVIGVLDPNPLVAGKGVLLLQQAGIAVQLDEVFAAKSRRVAEHFLWNMTEQMPYVTLKLAMSLDGKLAIANGESQWLTSQSSRFFSRRLRAHHDATMVGAGTVLQDNPRLDFRDTEFTHKKNKIFIWDPNNKVENFLPTSLLMKNHESKNIQILKKIDKDMLKNLYQQGITSLFVEGGGKTIAQFIENKLFNKIFIFIAPTILGDGRGWSTGVQLDTMADRWLLEFSEVSTMDQDIFITAYPKI